jgi:hypothetical protein
MTMRRLLLTVALIAAGLGASCQRGPAPSLAPTAHERAVTWLRTARFRDADPASDCRTDCGEQERGFAYARQGHVEQPGDCDLARARAHASEDFIEGCRAYGQYIEAAEREE